MIFDTHAHYDDEQFDEDREKLLSMLTEQGIVGVVDVGSTVLSLEKALELAHAHDFIYAALGLHPDEIGNLTEDVLHYIEKNLSDPKVVAVGEIGLDYYWHKEAREIQERKFRAQIQLALDHEKPIIVHSREAAEDTLRIIRDYYAGGKMANPGIIHCFSYSAEMAELYVKMGFYLGIGGVVTYKNARKLKEVVERIPLEHLVLETDCPYLTPTPNRGKRNSSLNLPYVVSEIASLKGMAPEEVEGVTEANARTVFNLQGRRERSL